MTKLLSNITSPSDDLILSRRLCQQSIDDDDLISAAAFAMSSAKLVKTSITWGLHRHDLLLLPAVHRIADAMVAALSEWASGIDPEGSGLAVERITSRLAEGLRE